jgi:hypothetical protein
MVEEASREGEVTGSSGVPLLNKFFFAIYFELISKNHYACGAYVTRQHSGQGWRVGTRQQR